MRKFLLWLLEPAVRRLEQWMVRTGMILHFGGGGSAPAPDPAIGEAAAANAELGREALDFAKLQYEEGKPANDAMNAMIEQVVQQQLRIGDKQEAQSDDYINYMKTTFRPIEESLASEAMSFDTEGKRAELAGKAAADVEQAAAVSDQSVRRDAARYGINPADAAFGDQMSGSGLNKTIMKVGAMNTARTQARAEGRALKFDAAGLGRGLPGAGSTAAQVAMQGGSNAVGSAATGAANTRAAAGGIQQGFSTAIGGNTAAGNLYGNVFDGNMQGYQAQQQARAGTAQDAGTAVGLIAAAFI
jgi:hypothetical protein